MIDSIEKSSKSLEESVSDGLCGVLYDTVGYLGKQIAFNTMMYYDVNSGTHFFMKKDDASCLYATREDIYYSSRAKIKKLFRRSGLFNNYYLVGRIDGHFYKRLFDRKWLFMKDYLVGRRDGDCYCIQSCNGVLMDAGTYGLYDTHRNKQLITRKQLLKEGFNKICSLLVDNEGRLLINASMQLFNNIFALEILRINKRDDKYFLGESVRKYALSGPCGHAVIIPGTDHIITSNNCSYLDLDGRIIGETRVNDDERINDIIMLGSNLEEQTAEVVYSKFQHKKGHMKIKCHSRIMHAAICFDGSRITAQVKPFLKSWRYPDSGPFELIRDEDVHEKLIGKGVRISNKHVNQFPWLRRFLENDHGARSEEKKNTSKTVQEK